MEKRLFLFSALFFVLVVSGQVLAGDAEKQIRSQLLANGLHEDVYRWKFRSHKLSQQSALQIMLDDKIQAAEALEKSREVPLRKIPRSALDPEIFGEAVASSDGERFWISFESVDRKTEKNMLPTRSLIAFDGEKFTNVVTPVGKKTDEGNNLVEGTIHPPLVEVSFGAANASSIEGAFLNAGFCFLPSSIPMIPGTLEKKLIRENASRFLQRLGDARISEVKNAGGHRSTCVELPIPRRGDYGGGVVRYNFSPQHGGALISVDHHLTPEMAAKSSIHVELQEWDQAILGPREVRYFDYFSGVGYHIEFSSIEVVPFDNEDAFVVKIPKNAQVIDHTAKMAFQTGSGP